MTTVYATSGTNGPNLPLAAEGNTKLLAAQEPDRLRRIGRRTFKTGSILFVVIGLLHTFVQLTDMAADDIRSDLQAIGMVDRVGADAWDLWQGLGLLMGFFMIALGLSNLAGLKGRIDSYPAAGVCAVNVAMFIAIAAIGYIHLGPMQLVGGPIGIIMFTIPMLANQNR